MRRIILVLLLIALPLAADEAADLAAARSVFEQNIEAIRQRDRAKYLSFYLQSERLARGGATGFTTGYEDFAKSAGSGWPGCALRQA